MVSDDRVAPMNTPFCQSRDWVTSGTVVLRRPPKMIAEIGTPTGWKYSSAMIGTWVIGVQKRELACAASSPADSSLLPSASSPLGVQSRPFQSVR